MDEPPIACTLKGSEFRDRLALWRQLGPAITGRHRSDGALRIVYDATEEVVRLLPALAAAERDCCAFAEWSVSAVDATVELVVRSSPDGLDALESAFADALP